MLYLTSLYCLLHTGKIQLFDDNEHRPIAGSCGHAICSECFQSLETPSCPLCQEENSFGQAAPNYTAIAMIEERRKDFWGTLKLWWSGENYGEGLCSKCVKTEKLRICLTCHQNELCESHGGKLRLRMQNEKDLIILARHAICAGCLLDKHVEGHKNVKIDDIKYSKKDIKMTTAGIILRLFRDGMRKKKGFIGCKLRHERVECTGRPLLKLLEQLEYTDEGECGYLGELIKMELIKKYIDDIDKKLNELFNKDREENEICECTHLYENLNDWGTKGTPTEKVTPEPFNERQCPTCVFIDYWKHGNSQKDFYQENWIGIIETFWKSEMPSFENFCVRCLERFNHRDIGISCKKLNKKEIIKIKESITFGRQYSHHGDRRRHNQHYPRKKNCEHKDCLMRNPFFWKYTLICHVDSDIRRIMNDGIRSIVSDCQLRKIRMQQLTDNVYDTICSLDLRKRDRRNFCAKTGKVDTFLESLKTQCNTIRNEAQHKQQCKCTVIWEMNKKVLEKTRRENYDASIKYKDLENKLKQMATFSLIEDIRGCPMDFDHGIGLDESVLEELENTYSEDYALAFEVVGITSQFEPQCKCKVICENNRKMLSENRFGDFDARQKRYDLQRKMVRLAKFFLKQDIGGCPMDLNHGIALNASVLEVSENTYSDDYAMTFEVVGITSGN